MTGARPSRRSALGLLGAASLAAGGVLAVPEKAYASPSRPGRIPKDVRPGGAYDRFVAQLAAEDKFSGTILLAHRGRTVLARSYGMADRERKIPTSPLILPARRHFRGTGCLLPSSMASG